jgi:hypothetical protein
MAESEESITLSVCYTIGNILGGDNQELMPLFEESSLMPVRWKSDSEETSQSIRLLLLESLFGENLDFVRRIADNAGNVTYLYGYGKKTFTYQSDGVLEYKNEAADATAGGFYKDLETALSFAAVNGLWDGAEASGLRLTLRNAEVISNGKQEGYRFGFGAHIAEHPLYYEAGLPLIVEVLDGQVSYLRSDMIAVERMPAHGQEKPVQDPANVIARNYNHIYNVSTGNVLSVNQDIAFQYVVSSVRDVRVGLVRLLNNEWLQPAWILETRGGQRFYFSLYEAIPIGTGK